MPILDRAGGRVLAALAASRSRIAEVGTAFGYSTLWMALAQPAGGTIVTIDPDRSRTDRARGWWRQAGIADDRITVVNRPALEAFAAGSAEPALAGPFDLVFIDASRTSTRPTSRRSAPRLARGRPGRGRQRPVERRPWPIRARPGTGRPSMRAFNAGGAGGPGLRRDDPAGRRRPPRGHASGPELAIL